MLTTIDLDALVVLRAVARLESFSQAAAQLGRDKSQVSRVIKGLEARVGARLFHRTTRKVSLTPDGVALLGRVAQALDGLEGAVREIYDKRDEVAGEVVITTTPDLGRAFLPRVLVACRQRYPAVSVRVVLSHHMVDLVPGGVDLAIRVGRPGGEQLVARKLGELAAGFYAAPSYLGRRGAPRTLDDVAAHERMWPALGPGQQAFTPEGPVSSPSVTCDDFVLLCEIAREGGGIALLPTYLAAPLVAQGSLERVLPSVTLGRAALFLVSWRERPLPPRVSAVRSVLLSSWPTLG